MNKIQQLLSALMIVLVLGGTISCKKTFDSPPYPSDNVNLVANMTIMGLKTYHTIPGQIDTISQDVVISGIVTANDQSGNFYKQLFIQDSTGAMQILVDASSLYATYPVGRRVYLKCKGLALSDYYGNMQLGVRAVVGGVASVQGIPSALVSQYLVGGSLNNPVVPITVNAANLGSNLDDIYINALIKLQGYEFVSTDTAKTYSDTSVYKSTQNRLISTGCGSGTKLTVRTSAYANFAGEYLPKGNGDITAIYTIYKSTSATKQLIIRNSSDVQFNASRCGQTIDTTPKTPITIAELRALYNNASVSIPADRSISGIVISDAVVGKNISSNNMVIQDGLSGILVYLPGGTLNYTIGDSVSINVGVTDSVVLYRGSLEIKLHSGATINGPIATGRQVFPRTYTIADLKTALSNALNTPNHPEYTLVKILNATATPVDSVYGGSRTLTDASDNITMYTRKTTGSPATFANDVMPAGAKTWTGYSNLYNTTPQFQIRNISDIQ